MTISHKYYMQGFGIQTKNINDLIANIEKEIDYVTKNMDRNVIILNNKLTYCSDKLENLKKELAELKEYALEEYNKLETKVSGLESQLNFLKANVNVITTKTFEGDTQIYAEGIAPSSVFKETGKTYPIFATRADQDISGRPISETYMIKGDTVSSTSAMYQPENKTKLAQVQAITGMMSVNEEKHQLILGF